MCVASAISTNLSQDFGNLDINSYIAGVNSFIERNEDDRDEYVLRTPSDLSNNNDQGTQASFGDFVDTLPGTCGVGGCDFLVTDPLIPYGVRLRGFFNVTADLVNQSIHFGFYADDAVSLAFFDARGNIYPVMVRPPLIGTPTWRLTETVRFDEPGLYPLEILYVELAEHAAMELSYFVGDFEDFECPASTDACHPGGTVLALADAEFSLFQPTAFFQAISGAPSFADVSQCQQCNRQFVGLPGNNTCPAAYYCNEAALCAPCDTALYCGPSCSPCGGTTPFCINANEEYVCVECRDDNDCRPGYECNLDTNTCYECNTDEECGYNEICSNNTCVTCDTSDSCAGNSCNCCPNGANGEPMSCTAIESGGPPVCVECLADEDCATGVCDLLIGRCVDELPDNLASDCCGPDCVSCPGERPYCLPTPSGSACNECRWDTDCAEGNFCQSGQCLPCTKDRRCGATCRSCEGDTPFCLDRQSPELSLCVACISDDQCASGTCDLSTYQCREANSCQMSCGADTPYCYGEQCVECYADTQCPCGGTCDPETFTCSESCNGPADCQGTEHCQLATQPGEENTCTIGPVVGESLCARPLGSAASCHVSIGAAAGNGAGQRGLLAMLGLMLLGLWHQRRSRLSPSRASACGRSRMQ